MTTTQKLQIKTQATPKHLTVIIERKKYVVAVTKDSKALIKKEIDAFNIRNSNARKERIISLLSPKAESNKTALMVAKKKLKNTQKEIKDLPKETVAKNREISSLVAQVAKLTQQVSINEETIASNAKTIESLKTKTTTTATQGRTWSGEKYG